MDQNVLQSLHEFFRIFFQSQVFLSCRQKISCNISTKFFVSIYRLEMPPFCQGKIMQYSLLPCCLFQEFFLVTLKPYDNLFFLTIQNQSYLNLLPELLP